MMHDDAGTSLVTLSPTLWIRRSKFSSRKRQVKVGIPQPFHYRFMNRITPTNMPEWQAHHLIWIIHSYRENLGQPIPHFGRPPRGPDLVKDYYLLVYHHKSYHSALLILLRTRHIFLRWGREGRFQ